MEKVTGKVVPEIRFFNMDVFSIGGHDVRALRHGMVGQPGWELFGPWENGDAVRSATEARRVLGERFAAGVATSTDLLDANVALLQAELDRTQAIANARLADARLARALGR